MRGTGGCPTGPIIGTNSTPRSPHHQKKLPKKVDLRRGCSRVEDQGQLGSCTAGTRLVGDTGFLQKKAGHRVSNLSRLFVYYNERAMEGTINDDAGAMIRDGVKTLVKLGVCSERKWPYKIAKFTNKPPDACYKDLSGYSQARLDAIAGRLNTRPRMTLGYRTPAAKLAEIVASMG